MPTDPSEYVTEGDVGERVIAHKKGDGVLRWVGTADFGKGNAIYCGVELDVPLEWGGGDGSVLGTAYFSCLEGRGVFLTQKRVELLPPVAETTPSPSEAVDADADADAVSPTPATASLAHATSPGLALGANGEEPDWSQVEPTEKDLKDATLEIQQKFLMATGDEKSIAFAKRMKELHVGSSSKKKDDWVPQYLKTIQDEKAMSKFEIRSTLSNAQMSQLEEAEAAAVPRAKERAIERAKTDWAARQREAEARAEADRARERLEAEQHAREEAERQERLRVKAERAERERLEAEEEARAELEARRIVEQEAERVEHERLDAERKAIEAAEQAEKERVDAEKRAHEAAEHAETERIAAEKEAKKLAERAELERLDAEKRAHEEAERVVRDQRARADAERAERQRADAETRAKIKVEQAERARVEALEQSNEVKLRLEALQQARVEVEQQAAAHSAQRAKEYTELKATLKTDTETATRNAAEQAAKLVDERVEEAVQRALANIKGLASLSSFVERQASTDTTIKSLLERMARLESRMAAIEQSGATGSVSRVSTGVAGGGDAQKNGTESAGHAAGVRKAGRTSSVASSAASDDDEDDSDDDGVQHGNTAGVKQRLAAAAPDDSPQSLVNTGTRTELIGDRKRAGPASLDNTGTRMGLIDTDAVEAEPSLDNTGQQMQVKGPQREAPTGLTQKQRVVWEREEQQRILTDHERKLQTEEFADERKESARSSFRDRFKKLGTDDASKA